MRHLSILAFGFAAGCLVPVRAQSQTALPSGAGTVDAVAKELRLLRQAIERQNATAARVQLLMGRLTLQDQRTARAQQTVERLQSELASAERERSEVERNFRAIAQRLEQATNDEPRQQLEEESRALRARLAESQSHVTSTESRLSHAKQALDVEAGRYEEIDTWLRDLDKQLQTGG